MSWYRNILYHAVIQDIVLEVFVGTDRFDARKIYFLPSQNLDCKHSCGSVSLMPNQKLIFCSARFMTIHARPFPLRHDHFRTFSKAGLQRFLR